MIIWPESYGLAPDHCISVLNGEYDIPYDGEPVILDLGANVGAFARWAKGKWPNSVIHCYEPFPANYELLCRTVKDYELKNVMTYAMAVADDNQSRELHLNGFNCGEWSLAKNSASTGEPLTVPCIDAALLPDADIIKVDTEGAELMILARLARCGKLARVSAIMLEYHSAGAVDILKGGLCGLGFSLLEHTPYMEHRGVLKFIR